MKLRPRITRNQELIDRITAIRGLAPKTGPALVQIHTINPDIEPMPSYHITATYSTGKGEEMTAVKHAHHLIDAESNESAIQAVKERHPRYRSGLNAGWQLVARKWISARLPKSTIIEEPA